MKKVVIKMSNEEKLTKVEINWYPGHMAKTKRMIREKYDLIDIVYELVDARIPFSSKIKDIYDIIGNKPKILIMTKKDLCDLKYTNNWIKYYENLGYKVLLVDLNDNKDINLIYETTFNLMQDILVKRKNKGLLKNEIRSLVIGIPNVGKSTLINKLCGKKVAKVENAPGVTKNLTWLKAKNDLLLLDTPGILWPKLNQEEEALNLATFTAIKEEILPINDVAIHIIKKLHEYYPTILKEKYGVSNIDDFEEVYEVIARKIGAIRKGEVDYDVVSKKIINDIRGSVIKNITFDNRGV